MKPALFFGALAFAFCTTTGFSQAAQQASVDINAPAWTDIIVVTARNAPSNELDRVDVGKAPVQSADAASLVARLPGASLYDNGPLSGQVQYRGIAGKRLAINVGGHALRSAGPNLMDPPLQYAPLPLLDRLVVSRGAAPVSAGQSLAASVRAEFKSISFSKSAQWEKHVDATLLARTNDESIAIGGVAGITGPRQRIQLLAAFEDGGDVETPIATLKGTRHERATLGVGYATKLDEATRLDVDVRRQEVGRTGNPALGNDIAFVDSWLSSIAMQREFSDWAVRVALSHEYLEHGMGNDFLRPSPGPMQTRFIVADAETFGVALEAKRALAGGLIAFGANWRTTAHDAEVSNPNNADFLIGNFPDIDIDQAGFYSEWTGMLLGVDVYAGVRVDLEESSAGMPGIGDAVPMGPRILANAFSEATASSRDETTIDGMIRAGYGVTNQVTLRAAAFKKSRFADYVERYAWLPTGASGGLADGNTYVGDTDINPESVYGAEFGFDLVTPDLYMRPTAYVKYVDDYIQGLPAEPLTPGIADTPLEIVSSLNGDPTPFRFSNVDALLYGFDADFGVRLGDHWRLDGVFSHVRGERDDVNDNLYRIPPARGRLGLTYERQVWETGVELAAVAKQNKTSAIHDEASTSGYVLANAIVQWKPSGHVKLSAGIENVFDRTYRDHMAGYNRNSGLGVGLGERLPGPGRGAWVRINSSL